MPLIIYTGPMASGKSDALISALYRREALRGRGAVIALRPWANTRDDACAITSRTGASFPAVRVASAQEVLALGRRHATIGVDEPHMFTGDIAKAILTLSREGRSVLVAGLDLDYLGRSLEPVPKLIAAADTVVRLTARCDGCESTEARYTHRKTLDRRLVVPGGSETYESLCEVCWSKVRGEGLTEGH